MSAGLVAGGFAAAIFALAFVVAFLYIASEASDDRAPTHPRARRDGLPPRALLGSGLLRRRRAGPASAGSSPPASSSRPSIYAIVGAVFALAALRNLIRGAIRNYFRLPRRQRVRRAALPVETISAPSKPR